MSRAALGLKRASLPTWELKGYRIQTMAELAFTASNGDIAVLQADLAQTIVAALKLEIAAAEIDPEAPLFGEGLGLDSIDALEIAVSVSERYRVQLRSDDPNNKRIFRSLSSLAEYIAAHLRDRRIPLPPRDGQREYFAPDAS